MENTALIGVVEALLFASDQPLTLKALAAAFPPEELRT